VGFMRGVGATTARVILIGALDIGMWCLGMPAWCFLQEKDIPSIDVMALRVIAQAKGAVALGIGYGQDTSINSNRQRSLYAATDGGMEPMERSKPSPHGPLSTS
jgi:hypothetical protein